MCSVTRWKLIVPSSKAAFGGAVALAGLSARARTAFPRLVKPDNGL